MGEEGREIWVGENRLYLGKDNTLYETVVGEQSEELAIAIKETTDRLVNMVEGKVNVLIDLNNVGKPSPGARRVGIEGFEDEKVGKVALFGSRPVARVVASFVTGVSKKKDMRLFKTKEEALAWLKK